jgi:hypothetical protein
MVLSRRICVSSVSSGRPLSRPKKAKREGSGSLLATSRFYVQRKTVRCEQFPERANGCPRADALGKNPQSIPRCGFRFLV